MMKNISCTVRVLAFVIMHFSIASATCDYHQKSAIGLCSENMKTSGEFAGISVEHVSRHFSNDNIYCGVRLRSSFMDKMINESNDTVFAGDRSLDKSFNAVESLKGDLLTIISNMPKSALYHKSQNIYKFDMGGYVSFGKRMASKKRSLGVFFGITFSNVFTTRFLGFDDLKLRESSIVDPYSKEVPRNKRYENIFSSAYGTNNKDNEFDLVLNDSGPGDMVKISTPILPDFTLMLIKILYRSSVIGIEYTNILELYNGSCVNTCVKIGTNMNMYEDMYYGISNCSAPGKYPNSRYIGMGKATEGNKAASSIIVTPYNIVDKDSTISSYNVQSKAFLTSNKKDGFESTLVANYFDSEEGNVSDLINRLSRVRYVNKKVGAVFLEIDVFAELLSLRNGLIFGCYGSIYIQKSIARIPEDKELMQSQEMQSKVFSDGFINALSSNYVFEYAAIDGFLSDFSRVCFGISLIYTRY